MTLTLNGKTCEPVGSLLDTILAAGIQLSHLCKDDNLKVIGACRTCMVEADGRIVAACSTPAGSVSNVSTESERAVRIRRGVLELTAAMGVERDGGRGGPHCDETKEAVEHLGAWDGVARRTTSFVDDSNPFFSFHESDCILCGRCVVACQSLQHISAIGMAGRGTGTRVTPGANVTFLESICTSCGSCVAACPTDALRPKGGTA